MTGGSGPVVLGLCAFTHDSSAALVVDGRLAGFAEEERLSGVKHTGAYPASAIEWLLDGAGLSHGDVDVVAYNFNGRRYLDAVGQLPRHLVGGDTRGRAIARAGSFVVVYRNYRRRMRELGRLFPSTRITGVEHHRAHGLYAFASSGFDKAAVLVVDSLGELQTTTIAHAARQDDGGGCEYRWLAALRDPVSLGYVYGAVTQHLGWPRGDGEGTVMALAALGDPTRFRDLFEWAIRLTPDGFDVDPSLFPLRVLSHAYSRVSDKFMGATCPARGPSDEIERVHADLAATLQERTEQVLVHLVRQARTMTGADRLCLVGGVAMNCVGVGKIVDVGLFEKVYVPSSPGDGGTAIGAAIDVHLRHVGALPGGIETECYLGPSFPALDLAPNPRPDLTARRVGDPVQVLASALADGCVVGLFRGRLEAGPRALGNRSILASPLLPDVVDRLNATVKRREPFRPFAPVVLADRAPRYFSLRQPAPYMSIAANVTDLARKQIPSIVHTNDTARVQTLAPAQNPFLAEVLAEFERLTGVPVLINTSLNVKGKPICGTPDMALDCLAGTGLDALLLEDWWVTK